MYATRLFTSVASLALMIAPAFAQDTLTSASDSNSGAVSGSTSGASSDNFNTNGQAQQANNAGIGNSTSGSASDSTAVAVTESSASSNGNQQGQTQGQDAHNSQGQGQSSSNTNSLGQQASNQQGVTVNQQWNSTQLKHTRQEFRTNAAVPLAASSSFSSDYCGGTASGGVSAAPIGISIGGAGPTFDKSCQSLRRAEKFGMVAANYHNLGQDDLAGRAMSMMVWSICTSDSRGAKADYETVQACMASGLMGQGAQPAQSTYVPPQADVTPLEAQKPNVEPLPEKYHTPRGELEFQSNPVIQGSYHTSEVAAAAPRQP